MTEVGLKKYVLKDMDFERWWIAYDDCLDGCPESSVYTMTNVHWLTGVIVAMGLAGCSEKCILNTEGGVADMYPYQIVSDLMKLMEGRYVVTEDGLRFTGFHDGEEQI